MHNSLTSRPTHQYDCIFAGGFVREVACHAHARRKFFETMPTNQFLCNVALKIIRYLYAIEKQGVSMAPAERANLRQMKAQPALRAFKNWLDWHKLRALPKSPFSKAITYALNNWEALRVYVDDGELSIDNNNKSERALRAVAVGRKNWMFLGSKEGGRTAACILSFIATAKQYGLNPYAYLKDVIERMTSGRLERLVAGSLATCRLISGSPDAYDPYNTQL